ncbi:hypothetical protein KXX33_007516 [Aspergillus fumigatus]|nr:hypothetical protein KXX33_007516 [Aspergillus fumigatus]KAH1363413.1 hypothetical protein KXX63_005672 [Aspergillus fumigatus]KAH1445403.1 hypothetical protein KXX68_007351 [Aspergillus fumigatus]KAH1473381.1 hypothetical protein KXX53_007077 [Aspergillus fumigatus]KAH1896688.1 hypothetical protein KXW04_006240 [Aspergillus fumigatus]
MDSSIKSPDYNRYAADFLSAVNGPSTPNYSYPPPQYTPRDPYLMPTQTMQTAKLSDYYYSRPVATQELANSTRQDEYHHFRTNPNLYHSRDPPLAADRNAPLATQNEYHCSKGQPEFYHHRRDGLNIASTTPQGFPMAMQAAAPTATENKLGQVAQQRGFYYTRPQAGPPPASGHFISPPSSQQQQAYTTSMRDAYYHRRDQGNIRKSLQAGDVDKAESARNAPEHLHKGSQVTTSMDSASQEVGSWFLLADKGNRGDVGGLLVVVVIVIVDLLQDAPVLFAVL